MPGDKSWWWMAVAISLSEITLLNMSSLGYVLFDSIWSTGKLLSKWNQSSHTLPLFYQLSLHHILNPSLSFPMISDSIFTSRFHLKELFLWLTHKKQLLSHSGLAWDCTNFVTSSGFTSNLSSLGISTAAPVYFLHLGLEPLRASIRAEINISHTPMDADIL